MASILSCPQCVKQCSDSPQLKDTLKFDETPQNKIILRQSQDFNNHVFTRLIPVPTYQWGRKEGCVQCHEKLSYMTALFSL